MVTAPLPTPGKANNGRGKTEALVGSVYAATGNVNSLNDEVVPPSTKTELLALTRNERYFALLGYADTKNGSNAHALFASLTPELTELRNKWQSRAFSNTLRPLVNETEEKALARLQAYINTSSNVAATEATRTRTPAPSRAGGATRTSTRKTKTKTKSQAALTPATRGARTSTSTNSVLRQRNLFADAYDDDEEEVDGGSGSANKADVMSIIATDKKLDLIREQNRESDKQRKNEIQLLQMQHDESEKQRNHQEKMIHMKIDANQEKMNRKVDQNQEEMNRKIKKSVRTAVIITLLIVGLGWFLLSDFKSGWVVTTSVWNYLSGLWQKQIILTEEAQNEL